MNTKSLKALSGFKYGTRMLTAGDEFTPTEAHGRLLVALGRASYQEQAKPSQQARKSEIEPKPVRSPPKPKPKPAANRRKPKKEPKE